MCVRHAWLAVWLCCLGCHSVVALDVDPGSPTAEQHWRAGQAAMKVGQAGRAIGFYEMSLQTDPQFTRTHMSLAAAFLEAGDEEKACEHLARYVAGNPEHWIIRGHYAELLAKRRHLTEARDQFERFVADAQEQGAKGVEHLIHGHTRLFEIAETLEDDYSSHLHRGIGLYWLATERFGLGASDGECPTEGLLCKAAGELAIACLRKPGEARPCWYLYSAWSRLAQSHPAQRWLRAAEDAAPFSYLSPAEQRGLGLVLAERGDKGRR